MESKEEVKCDSFVVEHEEILFTLSKIVSCDWKSSWDTDNSKLEKMLLKYMEMSSLLDPYLSTMVHCLIDPIERKLKDGFDPQNEEEMKDVSDAQTWETRYVLLIWLSLLMMAPFNLSSLSSSLNLPQLINTCKQMLDDPSATRDAAAICLSSILIRRDQEIVLTDFISWACSDVTLYSIDMNESIQSCRITGVLSTLASIFKHGIRETNCAFVNAVLHLSLSFDDDDDDSNSIINNKKKKKKISGNTKKLLMKLIQRIGLTIIPPRVRVKRRCRNVMLLRSNENNNTTISQCNLLIGQSSAVAIVPVPMVIAATSDVVVEVTSDSSSSSSSSSSIETSASDHTSLTTQTISTITSILLSGLADSDTIVRWSCAKGVGRLCERFSSDLIHQLVESLVSKVLHTNDDGLWHGTCLALAELTRRELIDACQLSALVSVLERGLEFDVLEGSHSIGSHVRDASCYVCWAIVRAYESTDLSSFASRISTHIMNTALFDREINCRRAASAAYQEMVGRLGSDIISEGISILTCADYSSVSNRSNSFLCIAPLVAEFANYRNSMLAHLANNRIFHWDSEIRELASISIIKLTAVFSKRNEMSSVESILTIFHDGFKSKRLAIRHGSLLGAASILRGLYIFSTVPTDLVQTWINVIKSSASQRDIVLTGNEILMSKAILRLIKVLCLFCPQLTMDDVLLFLDVVHVGLFDADESLSSCSHSTLRVLLAHPILIDQLTVIEALTIQRYYDILSSANCSNFHARGCALGLASSTSLMLERNNWLKKILDLFDSVSRQEKKLKRRKSVSLKKHVESWNDPETRRNVTYSLVELATKSRQFISNDNLRFIVSTMIVSCHDYTVDKRGDVGSWNRIAAMKGLVDIISLCVDMKREYLDMRKLRSCEVSSVFVNNCQVGCFVDVYCGRGKVVDTTQDLVTVSFDCKPFGCDDDFEVVDNDKSVEFITQLPNWSIKNIYASNPYKNISMDQDVIMPDIDTRTMESYVPDIEVVVLESVRMQKPMLRASFYQHYEFPITVDLSHQIVSALLKQLSEKLNLIRSVAGESLVKILNNMPSDAVGIPHRFAILTAIELKPSDSRDWSNANTAYEIVTKLMNLDCYTFSILSGLVISMGGITESLASVSTRCFLDVCFALKKRGDANKISSFGTCFINLLKEESKNDRVINPLLKSLDKLLSNDVFEIILTPPPKRQKKSYLQLPDDEMDEAAFSPEFGLALIERLQDILCSSSDISRLNMATDVLLHFVRDASSDLTKKSLPLFIMLLGHPFPVVRKHASEQLYIRLASQSGDDSVTSEAMDALMTATWDDDVALARPSQEAIALLLHVDMRQLPLISIKQASDAVSESKISFGSYDSLVRDAGF